MIISFFTNTFTIDRCSSYVTTLTEIADTKLQVAEAKSDAKAPTKEANDDAIKATGKKRKEIKLIKIRM